MGELFNPWPKAFRATRFEELIRPHVMPLYEAAYRFLGNRSDAEDLVQDLLVKLYPRTDEMGAVRELRPWLMRVLYRQFIDSVRNRSRTPDAHRDAQALDVIPDPVPGPEFSSANAELTQ